MAERNYDFVIRARPDVVYLGPLPPLQSLDAQYIYATEKSGIPSDVLYVVPRGRRASFLQAVLYSTTNARIQCCPEEPFSQSLGTSLRMLQVPTAIRRQCSLECLFPSSAEALKAAGPLRGASRGAGPSRAATGWKGFAPPQRLTEYEDQCHKRAHAGCVLGITRRVMTIVRERNDLTLLGGCFNASEGGTPSSRSFRFTCCAAELHRLCRNLDATTRSQIGWPHACAPPQYAEGGNNRSHHTHSFPTQFAA